MFESLGELSMAILVGVYLPPIEPQLVLMVLQVYWRAHVFDKTISTLVRAAVAPNVVPSPPPPPPPHRHD